MSDLIKSLGTIVKDNYRMQQEADRRVWKARDRIAVLEEQLIKAEARLVTEERELARHSETLQLVWEHFTEVETP